MQPTVRSILIIAKYASAPAAELAQEIQAWAEARGLCATALTDTREPDQSINHELFDSQGRLCDWPCDVLSPQRRQELNLPDLIVILGGDGTILSVGRKMYGPSTPIIGVNLGQVGFMSELTRSNWADKLERLVNGEYQISDRICLEYSVIRNEATIASGRAVNELVVNRGALARLINLDVEVNGEPLGTLRADGVIVATPTGATGYAHSANGPLLHPAIQAISVVSICPFLCDFNPLVLPADSRLSIFLRESTAEIFLTLDGQEGYPLATGDRIEITRAPHALHFATLGEESYFARLRRKGFLCLNQPVASAPQSPRES